MRKSARSLKQKWKKKASNIQQVFTSPEPTGSKTSRIVRIRVQATDLPYAPLPSDRRSSGHLYLIEGTFEDITRYAGSTVDWVIKIAHLLCKPLGNGRVYTHSRDTPQDRWDVNRDDSWEQVSNGDPLHSRIYEFVPTGPITLSKICLRQTRSVTSQGTEQRSNASEFRQHLQERDGQMCAVTGDTLLLVASHLIPRRLGTDGVEAVVTRFASAADAIGIHRYHPSIGILLFTGLDGLVDTFRAGFYHNTNNTYTLHNFSTAPNVSILGSTVPGSPLLHGYSVTLQVRAGDHPLPPPGVFNWHYLQCVIKMFGTPEYKKVSNIYFYIHPFRTASDTSGSDSGGDFNTKPPYPSYHVDQVLTCQMESHWAIEREKEISRWASGIPPASGISVQSFDDRTNNE